MKTIYILVFVLVGCLGFSQETNMNVYYELESELKEEKISNFLSYSVHKDNESFYHFKQAGIIEVYKDSIIYHKFIEENGEIVQSKKTFNNIKDVEYIKYYIDKFERYKPKCYQEQLFYESPIMRPPSDFSKNKIGCSRNEWNVSSAILNTQGNYEYKTSFKSKLFKFKCLGFFKNLKSRRMFNKLLKHIEN